MQLDGSTPADTLTAAATRELELLQALRPPGLAGSYCDRLAHDAADALEVSTSGTDSSSVDLIAFSQALAARGHEVWLRSASSPERHTTTSCASLGAGASARGASSLLRNANSSSSGSYSANGNGGRPTASRTPCSPLTPKSHAPRHTFVVARAPPPAAATTTATATATNSSSSEDEESPERPMFIVDPCFKEMVCSKAGAADAVYAALFDALPPVVVGSAEGLPPLIIFLCDQVRGTFQTCERR